MFSGLMEIVQKMWSHRSGGLKIKNGNNMQDPNFFLPFLNFELQMLKAPGPKVLNMPLILGYSVVH